MGSIIVIPKVREDESATKIKKKKPAPLTWEVATLHEVKLYAKDSFWDAWLKHHFDLSLIRTFYTQAPQLASHEEIKISDGKSVIIGKRTALNKAILTGGYTLNHIYPKQWVERKRIIYTPHYEVRVGIDHHKHFIKRYKERNFDLSLVAHFIGKVAQAKLGQRVKMISQNDILIGTRTTAHHAILISGMVRGEIDWDDYVDSKMHA